MFLLQKSRCILIFLKGVLMPDELTELHHALPALIERVQCGGVYRLHFGNVGIKARQHRGRLQLLVWARRGSLSDARLEEIGEDAGFYAPVIRPAPCQESNRARLIVEGLSAELCPHAWGRHLHGDGRAEFFHFLTCDRCGMSATITTRRRGGRQTFQYDEWLLREHIFFRWMKLGPPPGVLAPQAWHQDLHSSEK